MRKVRIKTGHHVCTILCEGSSFDDAVNRLLESRGYIFAEESCTHNRVAVCVSSIEMFEDGGTDLASQFKK